MAFEWDASYDSGDDQLDHQHRRLLALTNHALHADNLPDMARCMLGLMEYLKRHHLYEEAQMRRAHYPDTESHTMAHAYMVALFNELRLRAPAPAQFHAELRQLTSEWAFPHMTQEDARLAEYLGYGETRNASLGSL